MNYDIKSLDEFLQLPPASRQMRLGQPGMRDLICALGTEAGIAWLEEHIESPVGSDWGNALYSLRPSWSNLDRWIRQSKLHCLAAMDVLFRCTDPYGDGAKRRMPEGADVKSIHDAVDFALAHYGNPRLEKTAKEIRHAWPKGKRKRHPVNVPAALRNAAETILCQDSDLMKDWHEKLATGKDEADTPYKIWDFLVMFADSKNCLVIVDWKESPENIISSLRALKPADKLDIEWDTFNEFDGDNHALLRALANEVSGQGTALICLDHGCDDYALAFVPAECVTPLATSIATFDDSSMHVLHFTDEAA